MSEVVSWMFTKDGWGWGRRWTKKAHMAVQCPAFTFVKARGSLCLHKIPIPKALANHTKSVQEC